MAITELVIDRAKWGQSALLNKDGTMCCLGFLSKACGVPDEDMLGLSFPRLKWTEQYSVNPSFATTAARAARINDSKDYSKAEKETRLISLFAENGITLTFTGEHRSE